MDIEAFKTVDEARERLLIQKPGILSRLPEHVILSRLRNIKAGAFDFCGSLAVGSQWNQTRSLMRPDLRQEDEADLRWYLDWTTRLHDPDTTLDDPDWFVGDGNKLNRGGAEGAWLARSLDRLRASRVHRDQIIAAGRTITLRDGVKALFDLIPTRVVISMGIEDMIKASLEHHKLTAPIAAARLRFDENNMMVGYHPNLVVSSGKYVALERFRELNRIPVEQHMVLGDSYIDVEMMPEGAVNVWILPYTESFGQMQAFRNAHLAEMLDRVSLVLFSDSLQPLVDLIKKAREPRSPAIQSWTLFI